MTATKLVNAASNPMPTDVAVQGVTKVTTAQPPTQLNIKVPVIAILGGPGSGKGTQCARLVAKYKFTHISTGDLMRDEVKKRSPAGREAEQCMKEGRLVSDDVVLTILRDKIASSMTSSHGFILDGYPRSVAQAEAFEKLVGKIDAYIYLEVTDEAMLERLVKRGAASGRADDNLECAKKRIEVFHRESRPVVETFKDRVRTVPAEKPIDDVFATVDCVFGSLIPEGSRNVV